MPKTIQESPEMQQRKADFYCAIIPNEPVPLGSPLFAVSVRDAMPKEVIYQKNEKTGTYQLSAGSVVFFESAEPLRTTRALTRALAKSKPGATHLVCRTFGEATIVHQYLVGERVAYGVAMTKASLKWLATRLHILVEHRLALIRIELVYLRDMAKYIVRGEHR